MVNFYNTVGNKLAAYTLNSGGAKTNTTIDLSGPGIYLVTAANNNNNYKRRIIIK